MNINLHEKQQTLLLFHVLGPAAAIAMLARWQNCGNRKFVPFLSSRWVYPYHIHGILGVVSDLLALIAPSKCRSAKNTTPAIC
uniref:Uncharacterized protein n=1 Tax=Rhizophora mucronata TaxID=61149 RepID=A0A2P2LJP2_RHIMU